MKELFRAIVRFFIVTVIECLSLLLTAWIIQDGKSAALMTAVEDPSEVPWRWAARALMLAVMAVLVLLIRKSRALKRDEAPGLRHGMKEPRQ